MPFPYKTILCPIDLDDFSTHALAEAAAFAVFGGATVHLIHVVTMNPLVTQGVLEGVNPAEMYDSQIAFARDRVQEMAKALPCNLTRQITILVGDPAAAIVEMESKLGADLVVMASHGRRGLKHLVLGSVTESVARESHIPVLVVHPSH